ncbi:MAG TPA: MarR family transcriptional regulator [Burkholderiaceae bacterium]|nr:MarR family transcriptional regulator [Burkholderiaceae bacterium]
MPSDANPAASRTPRRGRQAPLDDGDYAALAAFRYALRRFLNFSEVEAAKVGLTGQHYQALLVVRASSGSTQTTINELAQHLLIKHNSAVGLVDRLVEQGLLLRKASRDDRRKVELQLTAKGSRVLDRLADLHRDELENSGTQLRELLQQVTQAMDRG